jgi:hypothetical protein
MLETINALVSTGNKEKAEEFVKKYSETTKLLVDTYTREARNVLLKVFTLDNYGEEFVAEMELMLRANVNQVIKLAHETIDNTASPKDLSTNEDD